MSDLATINAVHEPSARSDLADGASPPCKWRPAPGELVSLWDIMRFHAATFLSLVRALEQFDGLISELKQRDEESKGKSHDERIRALEVIVQFQESMAGAVPRVLADLKTHCEDLELGFSIQQLNRFSESDFSNWREMGWKLQQLRDRIGDELNGRHFEYISGDRAKYLDASIPFGQEVADKFPMLVSEMEQASRAIGFGLPTAAVFHLMRILEFSVKRLAKRLCSKVNLQQPWGGILAPIDDAIRALPGGPAATPAQNTKKETYSQVAAYLRHVKDAWRNSTMHPKRSYTDEEARNIFEGVKAFVQSLAKLR